MGDEQDRSGQSPEPEVPDVPPSATTMHLSAIGATETDGPPALGSGVDPALLTSLRPGTAMLVVVHGPNPGSRFLLDADLVTVGRDPSRDIFLDDRTVSREHAKFIRQDDRYAVVDDRSLNGTYVNGQRVDNQLLQTGDEVWVGRFRLVVHLGGSG
ncbi:MAG: FHA domain-containing protein [Angustibacter sp.]